KQATQTIFEFEQQVDDWVKGCPLLPYQRNNLASTYSSYGDLQFAAGQITNAEMHLRKALDLCERLAAEQPPIIEYWAWGNLIELGREWGGLLQFPGRGSEAEPLLRQAVEDSRRLVAALPAALAQTPAKQLPGEAEVQFDLARSCLDWGIYLHGSR